jgi:hypothetical protein
LYSAPAQLLEERDLRLDHGNPTVNSVEHGSQKGFDRRRGPRIIPRHRALREERRNGVEMRIESDAERVAEGANASNQAVRE